MKLSHQHRNRRHKNSSHKKRKLGCLKWLVFLLLLIVGGIYLFNSSLVNVGDIEVRGISDDQVSKVYESMIFGLKDEKIYGVEQGALTNLINEQFPYLKLNDIEYQFPNNLVLDMSERTEKYKFVSDNKVYVADEEGFVLGEVDESTTSADLNLIYDKTVEVGQKVQDATFQAGLIYSELNQKVKIENDEIKLELDNGGKVILPANDAVSRANEVYSLLQKLVRKYTIDTRQIDFIDLRFSKPVIKYKE